MLVFWLVGQLMSRLVGRLVSWMFLSFQDLMSISWKELQGLHRKKRILGQDMRSKQFGKVMSDHPISPSESEFCPQQALELNKNIH